MASRLLLLALLLTGPVALRAQIDTDGPIKMKPELALAIPLVLVKHDVTVKFPVLLNSGTVLRPGAILRNIYLPSVNNDSENLMLAHKGNMEESYSRPVASADGQSSMPPEVAHEIERQRRVVWEVPINFQLALAQLPTDNVHLIYARNGDNRNLDDQRFNFFDGLFLGSPEGGVSVLAVETGSKADAAGLKAGDRILSVGGTPVPADLAGFPALYSAVRKNAGDGHAASFPVVIRSPGETTDRTVNIAAPASIKSLLNEGM